LREARKLAAGGDEVTGDPELHQGGWIIAGEAREDLLMLEEERREKQTCEERPDELFTRKIYAGRRTYYLDVKVTSKNDKYLVISEKRRANEENKAEHSRVMIFKEDFHKFFNNLEEIKAWLDEHGEV
jgi:hypothetical protein